MCDLRRMMRSSAIAILGMLGSEALAGDCVAPSVPAMPVTTELSGDAWRDIAVLNDMRLRMKAEGRAKEAEDRLADILERADGPAVRLNLALAYVDQMADKSLIAQGRLSTRSQSVVSALFTDPNYAFAAAYIAGINNLYWPDWFGKAAQAETHLAYAVDIVKAGGQCAGADHALVWLGLGDARALQGDAEAARATWAEGLRYFPYDEALVSRLGIAADAQRAEVRATRDANGAIDTDLAFLWTPGRTDFTITLTGGDLFGPGPLPDQRLEPGRLRHLVLGRPLTGVIGPNNNGGAEPNVPGELRQGLVIDGKLSDGSDVQESVDVGYVELLNGNFKLFLAAVQSGPNEGRVNFFLDPSLSWTILDDIAIDPGFEVGVIRFENFTFSTAPRRIPVSWQTENGAPGASDGAGSLQSGDVVIGRLGDRDFDGFVDGIFNAVGRFPLSSIMMPGAPFAQTREFTSDIPVRPEIAAVLALAGHRNALLLAEAVQYGAETPLHAEAAAMKAEAETHLERAAAWRAELGAHEAEALDMLAALSPDAGMDALCAAEGALTDMAQTLALSISKNDVSGTRMLCQTR